jgi:hypothetical protein
LEYKTPNHPKSRIAFKRKRQTDKCVHDAFSFSSINFFFPLFLVFHVRRDGNRVVEERGRINREVDSENVQHEDEDEDEDEDKDDNEDLAPDSNPKFILHEDCNKLSKISIVLKEIKTHCTHL